MKRTLGANIVWLWMALLLSVMVGCSTQPKRDLALERLQDELNTLKQDTDATGLAPLAVSDAERAVRRLAEAGNSQDYRNHLAYMAERRIDLIRAEVRRQEATRHAAELNRQHSQLLVRISRLQADQARREAEQARILSAAQAEDAARARLEAATARENEMSASQRADRSDQEASQARRVADAQAEEAALARREAQLANEQAESLRRRLEHMQLRETDQGVVVTLGDVLFETGESELKPEAVDNMSDVVELLTSEGDKRIRIEGHTDSQGNADFNKRLSELRAESVRQALVNAGIDSARITVVGLGEDFPIASNDTVDGRSRNRRVDVILLDDQ